MLLFLLALDVLRIITYHTLSVCVWPTMKAVEKGGMVCRFGVSDY